MSFVALLEKARQDVTDSRAVLGTLSAKKSEGKKQFDLLRDISEYLFDIFDANCTEAYKIVAKLENEAVELFLQAGLVECEEEKEYPLGVHDKYQEFRSVFEDLVGGEIQRLGFTMEDFVESVRRSSFDSAEVTSTNPFDDDISLAEMGEEVMNIFRAVDDFKVWASEIKAQAIRAARNRQNAEET